MKIKKRWIFLPIVLIFIFLVTDISYIYVPEDWNNNSINYYDDSIKQDFNKSELTYVFDQRITEERINELLEEEYIEKDIKPKYISLKTVNIFGNEKIYIEKENPPINSYDGNELIFTQIPFYTKKIIINSIIELYGEEIKIERVYHPVFRIKLYEFWYYPFPFLWESINGKVIFRWEL